MVVIIHYYNIYALYLYYKFLFGGNKHRLLFVNGKFKHFANNISGRIHIKSFEDSTTAENESNEKKFILNICALYFNSLYPITMHIFFSFVVEITTKISLIFIYSPFVSNTV